MGDKLGVLIADKFDQIGIDGLEGLGCGVHVDPDLGPETISGALKATGAKVLVVRSTKVPASVFDDCGELGLVIRAGAGHDNIDSTAAAERGIPVCNCPGMNAVAVAELAFGHMLNLDRRISMQTKSLREGRWNKKEFSKAKGLKGANLLVVGMGSIGMELIKRAQAFEMNVSAQSRSMHKETARALGIKMIDYSRDALKVALEDADIVSVHVALTPDTDKLCGPGFFGAMKPGSMFINTSRGEIVNEQELIKAIKEKGVRAGLDVYNNQPSSKDCDWSVELAELPGVSLTHHVGASTDQAQEAVALEVIRIVRTVMEEERTLHVVNKDQLKEEQLCPAF
ncbi:MAG: NAD(P)-dependent oxidoreductase [Phycisphaerales bacterium]